MSVWTDESGEPFLRVPTRTLPPRTPQPLPLVIREVERAAGRLRTYIAGVFGGVFLTALIAAVGDGAWIACAIGAGLASLGMVISVGEGK